MGEKKRRADEQLERERARGDVIEVAFRRFHFPPKEGSSLGTDAEIPTKLMSRQTYLECMMKAFGLM